MLTALASPRPLPRPLGVRAYGWPRSALGLNEAPWSPPRTQASSRSPSRERPPGWLQTAQLCPPDLGPMVAPAQSLVVTGAELIHVPILFASALQTQLSWASSSRKPPSGTHCPKGSRSPALQVRGKHRHGPSSSSSGIPLHSPSGSCPHLRAGSQAEERERPVQPGTIHRGHLASLLAFESLSRLLGSGRASEASFVPSPQEGGCLPLAHPGWAPPP